MTFFDSDCWNELEWAKYLNVPSTRKRNLQCCNFLNGRHNLNNLCGTALSWVRCVMNQCPRRSVENITFWKKRTDVWEHMTRQAIKNFWLMQPICVCLNLNFLIDPVHTLIMKNNTMSMQAN